MHHFFGKLQNPTRLKYKSILLFCFIFLQSICYADINCEEEKKKDKTKPEPPSIGNFALPSPQRPGGLLSFGQRLPNENQTQVGVYFDYFSGKNKHLTELMPVFVYGITDNLSTSLTVPLTPSNRADGHTSLGLEDAFFQLEYGFYHDLTTECDESATIVTGVTSPSGSTRKNPPTGLGSPSLFLGATYSRMYTDWFGFLSDGILVPTQYEGTKVGNTFFYQGGLGRNIFSIKSELTLAWLAEVNGLYIQKTKINSKTDHNSGGNTVYLTPSLQVCLETLVLQVGVGFPIIQHLFGHQNKNNYLIASNLVWTF